MTRARTISSTASISSMNPAMMVSITSVASLRLESTRSNTCSM